RSCLPYRYKPVHPHLYTLSLHDALPISIQVEQAIPGVKFNYVPFKGGGEVCVNLVGKHIDTTVNNPIECVSHWKAGRVRPLAVFDTARIPEAEWKEIPTVKEALGVDLHYLMLRG